jgi:hypothetical protein
MFQRNTVILLALMAATELASAQWLGRQIPGTPRGANGKANLAAPTPRTADGKPDLSGMWQSESEGGNRNGVGSDGPPNKYFSNVLADVKQPDSLMRPDTLALYRKYATAQFIDSPLAHC